MNSLHTARNIVYYRQNLRSYTSQTTKNKSGLQRRLQELQGNRTENSEIETEVEKLEDKCIKV